MKQKRPFLWEVIGKEKAQDLVQDLDFWYMVEQIEAEEMINEVYD